MTNTTRIPPGYWMRYGVTSNLGPVTEIILSTFPWINVSHHGDLTWLPNGIEINPHPFITITIEKESDEDGTIRFSLPDGTSISDRFQFSDYKETIGAVSNVINQGLQKSPYAQKEDFRHVITWKPLQVVLDCKDSSPMAQQVTIEPNTPILISPTSKAWSFNGEDPTPDWVFSGNSKNAGPILAGSIPRHNPNLRATIAHFVNKKL